MYVVHDFSSVSFYSFLGGKFSK